NEGKFKRWIECRNIYDGRFIWKFPTENNSNHKTISDSLNLADISPRFQKVIIHYFGNHLGTTICLNLSDGSICWEIKDHDFLGIFEDSEKFLITNNETGDNNDNIHGMSSCWYYECRDIENNKTIWKECLRYFGFSHIFGDTAFFSGLAPHGHIGAFNSDTPPKNVEYSMESVLLHIFNSELKKDEEVISKWSKDKQSQYKRIEDYARPFCSQHFFEYKNIFATVHLFCGSDWCEFNPYFLNLYDKNTGEPIMSLIQNFRFSAVDTLKNGRMVSNTANRNFYQENITHINIAGNILQVGGFSFDSTSLIPIDIPENLKLQHYSETTGYYYFFDTENGEIVCLSLEE
ncbi:MAG: hypothetical protein R2883_08705, partial [Caldisericia bacterium]